MAVSTQDREDLQLGIEVLLGEFKRDLNKALDNVKNFAKKSASVLGNIGKGLKLGIPGPGAIVGGLTKGLSSVLGVVTSVVGGVIKIVTGAITQIWKLTTWLLKGIFNALKGITKAALTIATGIVAGLAAQGTLALVSYARLEQRIAEVRSLTGATKEEFADTQKELQRMAVAFGASSTDLAGALYDIVSASFEGAGAVEVLRQSVIAAQAGLVDTKVAADAITTVLNSFSMGADQAGRVADVLFMIVKKGKTTFGQLAPNMGKVTSLANAAGASLEDVGAVIASLTRSGVQTEEAMTGLRAMLTSVIKPTTEAKTAFEALRKQNTWMTAELSASSVKRLGFVEWMRQVMTAGKGDVEVLAEIFPNIRALAGASVFAGAKLQGLTDDLAAMKNATGAAAEAQKIMTDTLAFQYKRFVQTTIEQFAVLGGALAPLASKTLKWLNEMRARHFPGLQAQMEQLGKGVEKFTDEQVLPRLQKIYDYLMTRDWGAAWKGLPETLGAVGSNLKDMLKLFVMRGAEGEIIAGPLTETFLTAFRWLGEQIRELFHWLWQDVLDDLRKSLAAGLAQMAMSLGKRVNAMLKESREESAQKQWEDLQRMAFPGQRKKWEDISPEDRTAFTNKMGRESLATLAAVKGMNTAIAGLTGAANVLRETATTEAQGLWQQEHQARIAEVVERLGQVGFATREEFGARIDNLIHALTRGLPGSDLGGVPTAIPGVAPQTINLNLTVNGVMDKKVIYQVLIPELEAAFHHGLFSPVRK